MDFDKAKDSIETRMKERGLAPPLIEEFLRRVNLVREGFTGKIPWNEIDIPEERDLIKLENLPSSSGESEELKRLVVIKLNGGLGTSMGLSRAKSIIPVKGNQNFLSIIKRQIELLRSRFEAPVPLLFMNSFNTREDTLSEPGVASINKSIGLPPDFLQNMVPRILEGDFTPIGDGSEASHWCPPGHGDLYLALHLTGILDRLLDQGYRVAFISNGDNLGAMVEPSLLSYFIEENLEFAMEITPKTEADIKGGVLIRHNRAGESRVELLEVAQVEEDHIGEFQDLSRFPYFNTNNLWINLEALRDRMKQGGLALPIIINRKEAEGRKVLQLETAMGSAIGQFSRSKGIVVPRDRFAPVKSCSDLLLRRSDLYTIRDEDSSLHLNPERKLPEPKLNLNDFYKKLSDFESLIPVPPSLLQAEELTVEGPVLFDVPLTIRGRVTLRNSSSHPAAVSILKRDLLEGELVEFPESR